jgi:transcriptional regulator with XRE-family HTH domain
VHGLFPSLRAEGEGGEVSYYTDPLVTLLHGDCIEVMAGLEADSVDAVVTDPPYGLEFMGKEWDGANGFRRALNPADAGRDDVFGRASRRGPEYRAGRLFGEWCEQWGREALRVTKPGGYLLAFGGTRTHHRLVCALEDAGWIIRDELTWVYASGFPKSLDVGKALDKRGGADISWFGPWLRQERERRGITQKSLAVHFPSKTGNLTGCVANWELSLNLPTVEQFNTLCEVLELPFTRIEEAEREVIGQNPNIVRAASSIQGFGKGSLNADITAASSDIARKWDGWGTALKPAQEPIVLARKPLSGTVASNVARYGTGALNIGATRIGNDDGAGRWPSNVLLSDPELFDQANPYVVGSGATATTNPGTMRNDSAIGGYHGTPSRPTGTQLSAGDSGGYSRFFIVPKSDRSERERGLDRLYCTCKTVKPERWERQDRNQPDQTATASRERAISGASTKADSDSNTTLFGSSTSELSPQETRSTTSMETSSTTESRTSSPSIPSPISDSIPGASSSTASGGSDAPSAPSIDPSTSSGGTSRRKAGRSTADAVPATSSESSPTRSCAECGRVVKPHSGSPVEAGDGVAGARRNSHPT